jgi:hypothetical protein
MRDHIVLDPADYGRDCISLYHLIRIAINEPQSVLPRTRDYGRRGGKWETKKAWQLRAVAKVLNDNGIDYAEPAIGPMVKAAGGPS